MAEFAYNNNKNASIGHMHFELNCGYYICVFFKENTNPCSQSKLANKLSTELWNPMTICQENLYHVQKF